jgi:hypothetical protein
MFSGKGAGGSWGLSTAHPQEAKSFESDQHVAQRQVLEQETTANKSVTALPDLHALVVSHGSYSAILIEAWAAYDAAIAAYRAAQIERIRRERGSTARNSAKSRKGGAR